jgi:hypothetical protein
MKRVLFSLIMTLFLFVLSACDGNNSNLKLNTVSNSKLTEKEQVILSTTTDQSFVFDFRADDSYKEVSVWVEKYEKGKLVEENNRMTSEIKNNGMIFFTTSKTSEETNESLFTISIHSDGSTSTGWTPETLIGNENETGVVSGSNPSESIPFTDKMVLASMSYSINENGMRTFSNGFYEDVESGIDELKNYDVVYLLRCEFKK